MSNFIVQNFSSLLHTYLQTDHEKKLIGRLCDFKGQQTIADVVNFFGGKEKNYLVILKHKRPIIAEYNEFTGIQPYFSVKMLRTVYMIDSC